MAAEVSFDFDSKGLQLLQKCPKEDLKRVIHSLLDTVCNTGVLRYQDYNKIWSIVEWKLLTCSWISCLRLFVENKLSIEKIYEKLEQFSVPKDVQKMVIECFGPRKDEIRLGLIDKTCDLSHATLKDFDWKLKLIMATDKLANMREPVLSLDLDILEKQRRKEVSVELSKGELKELISSLEAANKIVMQLK